MNDPKARQLLSCAHSLTVKGDNDGIVLAFCQPLSEPDVAAIVAFIKTAAFPRKGLALGAVNYQPTGTENPDLDPQVALLHMRFFDKRKDGEQRLRYARIPSVTPRRGAACVVSRLKNALNPAPMPPVSINPRPCFSESIADLDL